MVGQALKQILTNNKWNQTKLAHELTASDPEGKAFTRWNERVGRMLKEEAKINTNDIVTINKATDVDLRPEFVGEAIESLGYEDTIAEAVHEFLADERGELKGKPKKPKKK